MIRHHTSAYLLGLFIGLTLSAIIISIRYLILTFYRHTLIPFWYWVFPITKVIWRARVR